MKNWTLIIRCPSGAKLQSKHSSKRAAKRAFRKFLKTKTEPTLYSAEVTNE